MKQLLSILLSLVVYTIFLNWKASLLVVIGIGFHEQCHLWAAQKQGMKTNRFYMIPFVGGVALITSRYRTLAQRAFVVLAGPAGGGALAIFTGVVYFLLSYGLHINLPWLAAAAYWMLFVNLLNTAPFSFIDGGQLMGTITYSISRGLGVICLTVSTVLAILLTMLFRIPILGMIIGFFGGMTAFSEIRNWRAWRKGQTWLCTSDWINPPKKLTLPQIALTMGSWATAIVVLTTAMFALVKAAPEAASLRYFFHT
jgi:hypothetical protein